MARLSLSLLVLIFIIMTSSSHGRKLLLSTNEYEQKPLPPSPPPGPTTTTLLERLYMAALPKGTVPSSAPTKRGHADIVNQKLFARHLRAIDRILYLSNPSPGSGH